MVTGGRANDKREEFGECVTVDVKGVVKFGGGGGGVWSIGPSGPRDISAERNTEKPHDTWWDFRRKTEKECRDAKTNKKNDTYRVDDKRAMLRRVTTGRKSLDT